MKPPLSADDYLAKLSPPFQDLMSHLRTLIITEFPSVKERVMQEGLWYERPQGVFYLAKIGDHINLGVSIKGLSQDQIELFEGTGKTQRHLKNFPGKEINDAEILQKLQIVWDHAT